MPQINTDLPHCSLFRRLAVMLYDALLLLAVLFIATALVMVAKGGTPAEGSLLFTAYLIVVAFLFFAWFWTHGGQTLGMRAWNVRVQTFDGKPLTWLHAFLRFAVAVPSWGVLGLGFLWSLVDKQKLTWHDHYSETVLVVLPKVKRPLFRWGSKGEQ